jgi:phenylalanyl-tRNA synthetase beta chain
MELKRLAEYLMPGAQVCPAPAKGYEHPARAAGVAWHGRTVARLFELHPSLVEGRAAVLDVDLESMQAAEAPTARYRPLRRFPTTHFDLSVIAGLRVLAGDLERILKELAGADLVSIEFVRQYSGPPLEEGQKSVSFRLTLGANDRTLSSEEAGAVRARLIDGVRRAGYELRL